MEKTCIFIIGMHRSGTSAIAGSFEKIGYNIGKDILDSSEYNTRGYFENSQVINTNNVILESIGLTWDNTNLIDISIDDILKTFGEQILDVIQNQFKDENRILIKDPRLCILLPVWERVLKSLGFNCKIIIVLREPKEIAKSLEIRNNFEYEKSSVLILNYLLYIFESVFISSHNNTYFIIDFNSYIINPISVLNKIITEFNLSLKLNNDKKGKIQSFISTKLKHYNSKNLTFNSEYYCELLYKDFSSIDDKGKLAKAVISDLEKAHKLYKEVQIISSKENDNQYEAQLYYDLNDGYTEDQSIKIDISKSTKEISYDISEVKGIKRLRFDPANTQIYVKLISIFAEYNDGSRSSLSVSSNSIYRNQSSYLFNTADPNFFLLENEIEYSNVKNVIILLDILSLGNQVFSILSDIKEEEIKTKRLEIESLKKELIKNGNDIHVINENNNKYQTINKTLVTERVDLNKKFKLLEAKYFKVRDLIAQKNGEIKIIQTIANSRKDAILDMKKENANLIKELSKTKTQNERLEISYNNEIKHALEKSVVNDSIKEELQREKVEYEIRIKGLEVELSNSLKSISSIGSLNNENLEQIKYLNTKILSADFEIKHLTSYIADYKKINHKLENEKRRIEVMRDKNKDELKRIKNENSLRIEKLEKELGKANNKIDKYKSQIANLEDEIKIITNNTKSIEDKSNKYIHEIEIVNDKNIANKNEILELKIYVRGLLGELEESKSNSDRIIQQLKSKNSENSNLWHEIDQIKSSVSYKVGFGFTSPLRFVHDFVNRKKLSNTKKENKAIPENSIKSSANSYDVETKEKLKNFDDNSAKDAVDNLIRLHIDDAIIIEDRIMIRGWALHESGIKIIEIFDNDGNVIGTAIPGKKRYDLKSAFPDIQNSEDSEYTFSGKLKSTSKAISIRATNNLQKSLSIATILENRIDLNLMSLSDQYTIFLKNKNNINKKSNKDKSDIYFQYNPLISIVIPVYNVERKWLEKCVESVINQIYENWELILYDDCSTSIETKTFLKELQSVPKIIVKFGKKNLNISLATNAAISFATGEFIAFADNDDELSPNALFKVVERINEVNDVDLVYTDEDKIDESGNRYLPHFKSDFNIDLLRCQNYICHFVVVRKSIGEKLNWLRKGYEGAQDHDFLLRVASITNKIEHVPEILYHWRSIQGSTASNIRAKEYVKDAGIKAVSDHLKNNNIKASNVEEYIYPGTYTYHCNEVDISLGVTIIIPLKDEIEILKTCIDSIFERTKYENFNILLISNNSTENKTYDYLELISKDKENVNWIEFNKPFNYSEINNYAVNNTKTEFVLFLNNDIEVITEGWLMKMMKFSQRVDVGAVGAKLLYHDNTIQHAGVILGIGGVAGHAHKHLPRADEGYFGRPQLFQNISACTAACLLVRRNIFLKVNGFDEANLKVAFNDIDLCLKIREIGFLIVYSPEVELYHYESKSRGEEDSPEKMKRFTREIEFMKTKWGGLLKNDPYFNNNFSKKHEIFHLDI